MLELIDLFGGLEEWLGVVARKATNLPEELTEGRMLCVPSNAPLESAEISWVEGLHESPPPEQVSRK